MNLQSFCPIQRVTDHIEHLAPNLFVTCLYSCSQILSHKMTLFMVLAKVDV